MTNPATPKIKIILSVPGFFALPLKKIEIESPPNTGRTYFLYRDQIVAVARPIEEVADGEDRTEGGAAPRPEGAAYRDVEGSRSDENSSRYGG